LNRVPDPKHFYSDPDPFLYQQLQKSNFFLSVHFYSFVFVSWKNILTWIRMNLDLELFTDPDPNLQIILVPAGFGYGCTTLLPTPFFAWTEAKKSLLRPCQMNEER
jgi:hypothetical protein